LKISMDWKGGLKFTGISQFGHEITTDGSKKAGGEEAGYQPPELMLFGLAGCTGIDVVLIAQKMKQQVDALTIHIESEQKEDHPKFFTRANIEYVFTGKNLDRAKLERAVELSQERYCSVSNTIGAVTKITHSITINDG
jgi:putative redox protein